MDEKHMKMVIEQIAELYLKCNNKQEKCFPPTALFNETWMLRLILDWFKQNNDKTTDEHFLHFSETAKWYSEPLLPTPFIRINKPEHRTSADAILGEWESDGTKEGVKIPVKAKQFFVLEAKMNSGLSKSTKNTQEEGYLQSSRTIACMIQMLYDRNGGSEKNTEDNIKVAYYVIAPEEKIKHIKGQMLQNSLSDNNGSDPQIRSVIKTQVECRVKGSEGSDSDSLKNEWLPYLNNSIGAIHIGLETWEDILDYIKNIDADNNYDGLSFFYQKCIEYNLRGKSV